MFIEDVIIKKINTHNDERGSLVELFRNDELSENNLPQMGYESITNPYFVRGPHEHREQDDLFVFPGPGDFELYLWDNREKSKTFETHTKILVGQSNPCYVIIPAGVVHGYKNISPIPARVLNFPNKLYAGFNKQEAVDEIRHEKDSNSKFKI